ncbi:blood group Rh(CE) polypeptide isoform 4-T4 [Guaruba guarouba]
MPSSYRNFRNSVPWLILSLEAVFIVLFNVLFPYDGELMKSYPAFQDVNHMMIFGFGFFLMFLKRYGFSTTGFNLLLMVLGVQCSMLIDTFILLLQEKSQHHLERLIEAAMSMTAVVISTGAVLGKANPVQLILMTVLELIVFRMTRWMNDTFLQVTDNISMMHVHLFGAYFGLAFSSCFSEPSPRTDKNARTPKSDLLSMLGTLFLWVFWPSFNSVLSDSKWRAIYNTYFGLAVSAVTAFALSVLTTKDGKFRMRCLNPPLKLHDTSGVHFTFGMPAVLGALAQVILLIIKNWNNLPSLGYLVMIQVGAFCLTISVALITGLIAGLILNLRLFKTTPVSKYFEDQFYWEFPHLAVGF